TRIAEVTRGRVAVVLARLPSLRRQACKSDQHLALQPVLAGAEDGLAEEADAGAVAVGEDGHLDDGPIQRQGGDGVPGLVVRRRDVVGRRRCWFVRGHGLSEEIEPRKTRKTRMKTEDGAKKRNGPFSFLSFLLCCLLSCLSCLSWFKFLASC